ncbi:hypothetical protein Ahy_B02g059987 isoform B [Arachis hypogaea]|nr:hypothetical protein Ahy_B02g059987 isoform B [Arachis hypogaea]
MQATCKVFLDVARSSAVYKVASMAELPIAFGYDDEEHPEDGFLYRSAHAGNPAAIFRIGMREFFWMGRFVGGGGATPCLRPPMRAMSKPTKCVRCCY